MTIQKIAVGVDLSPGSELAIAHAMNVARRSGAQVVLIHAGVVADPIVGVPDSMRGTADVYGALLRERLGGERARVEALRQRLVGQGVEVSHVFVDGIADQALADTARELGADLLVVGTHGRTGLERFLLGSVAEKAVRLASSSVLVARGEPSGVPGGYHRILVGTDFSPLSDVAIARAMELAADGAHVHILHAWHVPPPIAPESVVAIADLRVALAEESEKRGAELLRTLRGRRPGLELAMETDEAPAQQALIDRATALGADLIAVGSHGRRGIRRWVLGSVAEVTVRHASCSVLVAR